MKLKLTRGLTNKTHAQRNEHFNFQTGPSKLPKVFIMQFQTSVHDSITIMNQEKKVTMCSKCTFQQHDNNGTENEIKPSVEIATF